MWLMLEALGAPVRPILSGTGDANLLALLVIPADGLLKITPAPDTFEMCTAKKIEPRLAALSRTAKGKTCM